MGRAFQFPFTSIIGDSIQELATSYKFRNFRMGEDDCEVVGCAIELSLRVSKLKILNLSFAI